MNCLIVGSGVAGPTLAYWLARSGHRITLVEQAPALRTGGYVIDFWGAGFDVAERMGVLPAVRARGYQVQQVRMVGSEGEPVGGFSAAVFDRLGAGRYTSLARGDLAEVLYREIEGLPQVQTRFGVELESLEQRERGVWATFAGRGGETSREVFDVVVGADGLHSKVRALSFSGADVREKYLGYRVAAFRIGGYRPRAASDYVMHTEVGRQMARFSMRDDETMFLLVWADPDGAGPLPRGIDAQRAHLRERFAGMRWEAPTILGALDDVDEIYLDRVSQIRLDTWSQGRVVLVGDAAHAPSLLAGQGSALAMIGAYVLAGELGRASTPEEGFARYHERLGGFMASKQKAAAGFAGSFAPRSRFGLWVRNRMTALLRIPFVADLAMGSSLRDAITLPDYPFGDAPPDAPHPSRHA